MWLGILVIALAFVRLIWAMHDEAILHDLVDRQKTPEDRKRVAAKIEEVLKGRDSDYHSF